VSSADTSIVYNGSPLTDGAKYHLRIRVSNGTSWGSWRPGWFLVRTIPFTINVPSTIRFIQEALHWAVDGDTVLVADGEYVGDDNWDIDFQGKGVLLMSENGPETTIINCTGSLTRDSRGFVFTGGEDSTTIVRGFTILNGYAYQGGAIYCVGASPAFVDCIIDSSTANTFGGGVYCDNSSPSFTDCVFRNNESIYNGGAIYCANSSSLQLTDCTLSDNRSGSESPVISGSGAGICCIGSNLQMVGCDVVANWAMNGSAGAWCQESSVSIHGCMFLDNVSYFWVDFPQEYPLGGALGLGDCPPSSIDSSLFAGNSCGLNGGALGYSNSTGTVTSCTFTHNFCDSSGSAIGGLGEGSTVAVENSIIAFNPGSVAVGLVGDIALVCCDVYGNGGDWVGGIAGQQGTNGNFSENPTFCGALNGRFALGEGSPCLPDGNSCGVLVGMLGLGCSYFCGDVDHSEGVDIDDVVYLVNYIFMDGEPPAPMEVGDVDCSGSVDIDDVVWLIAYIFSGGNAPCDTDGDGLPDC
jgi:predicted outer membrane repeat protein